MANKIKRVLHISDALPDYHSVWGGAEKVAFRQIKMSVELNNFEIFVASTKSIKPIKENFHFFSVLTAEDFLPQKISRLASAFKNQIFPFDLISFFSLFYIFLKIRPKIIHLHKTVKISLTPIIVAKIFRIPVVLAIYDYWYFCPNRLLIDKQANPCYRFHGRWCRDCSSLGGRPPLRFLSLFRRKIFDFFLSKINRFSVLSESCRELIAKYPLPKEKIFLVRQLSITPKNYQAISIESNSIFFNTWMLPHKGVHIVVRAFSEVLKKIPQAKLYMTVKDAGNYSDYNYYQEIIHLIEELNLKNNIVIIGKPNHQEYLNLISRANVVVVAEQWENMAPTTLADAMSFGKAIVASNIGGLPEMLKDGESGLLANPKDPKDFAEKIIKILSDSFLARELGQKAMENIKNYGSEEVIKEQLLNLYQL
ncbi:MAG: glycosyltransferase family 4 protein [Patescibacteria group bacterium]